MPARLCRDAGAYGLNQVLARKAAQVDLGRRVQAGLETPICRHAYAVAAAAEPVGHGPYETHASFPAGRLVQLGDALATRSHKFRHGRENLVCRDETPLWPAGTLPHPHELDEAHGEVTVARKLGQGPQLVIVHAADEHTVDLGVGKACVVGRLKAGQRVSKRSATRDGLVARGVERIQAHVEAREPRTPQAGRNGREQRGVGGHVHFVDARHGCDHAHQINDATSHQGFSARETHLAHTQRCRRSYNVAHLLEGEDVGVREHGHAVIWHAVYAAAVTAVGHREAQVAYVASKLIAHVTRLRSLRYP